jgi:hypothetical protein
MGLHALVGQWILSLSLFLIKWADESASVTEPTTGLEDESLPPSATATTIPPIAADLARCSSPPRATASGPFCALSGKPPAPDGLRRSSTRSPTPLHSGPRRLLRLDRNSATPATDDCRSATVLSLGERLTRCWIQISRV